MKNKKRGQIWIETMIYTLIAFALIGTVLSFAKPKIEELQDRDIIDQSIVMLKEIDEIITDINQAGDGNKRGIEVKIKDGAMMIDPVNNKIFFELKSNVKYSEPGIKINEGKIIVLTEEKGSANKITLTLNYTDYDITYNGEYVPKILSKDSEIYDIYITNKGGSPTQIDFSLIK